MSVLKQFLSVFTGNPISQALLEKNVKYAHYLMGVGCGTRVTTSGELALVKLVEASESSPCCVFDVGANVGQFLDLVTGRSQRTDLTIHSFEPGREAFARLHQRFGSDGRIHLNNTALGSQAGEATLFSDQPASGLSSLTRRDLSHVNRSMDLSQTVQVDTLDGYCSRHGITSIDLLKIDVEGHEWDVLHGAKALFESQAIHSVTFEFGGTHVDTRCFMRDFFHFFREREMDLYRITPRGYLRHLPRYSESLEQFVTTNYLAQRSRRAA